MTKVVINRPGVAETVLQTASSLTSVTDSQLRDLFCQSQECIENFSWPFFWFERKKERKNKKQKQIESVLREKIR